MNEDMFVDLCILIGNDFSGHLQRNSFSFVSSQSEVEFQSAFSGQETFEKLCAVIRDMGVQGYSLTAKRSNICTESVAKAIEFSRDFYNLRNLSSYPFDRF
jgi:hypothetical protein